MLAIFLIGPSPPSGGMRRNCFGQSNSCRESGSG
jgi:hypothetical protein